MTDALKNILRAARRQWIRLNRSGRAIGVAALVLVVAACGGGVGSEGTGTFGYSSGPISGFGSIIVNGVRFDDSGARVEDEDGQRLLRSQLKLGMTVQVDSGEIVVATGSSSAVANRVRVVSELRGRVTSVDSAGGTLAVLGLVVRTTGGTVFDDSLPGGLADLRVGDVLEVYGALDAATGEVSASRIEPDDGSDRFAARGVVAGLNTTTATFRIGSQTFAYGGVAPPAGLTNGSVVKVLLNASPNAQGQWVVAGFGEGVRVPEDDTETEIKGGVTAYSSSASFSVDGVPVDAGGARFEPSAAAVVLGARVEVEGLMRAGVLVATKVKVDDEGDDAEEEREVNGEITAADAATKSFVVRGVAIVYDNATRFDDGTAADLAVGREVEVEGVLIDNGTRVRATRIKFDD